MSVNSRLAKLEKAQSKNSAGHWVLPFPAFYGRNCKPIWQEKIGSLADFYLSGSGYCPGCTKDFCKNDTENL
jgi:hypothetical protein